MCKKCFKGNPCEGEEGAGVCRPQCRSDTCERRGGGRAEVWSGKISARLIGRPQAEVAYWRRPGSCREEPALIPPPS